MRFREEGKMNGKSFLNSEIDDDYLFVSDLPYSFRTKPCSVQKEIYLSSAHFVPVYVGQRRLQSQGKASRVRHRTILAGKCLASRPCRGTEEPAVSDMKAQRAVTVNFLTMINVLSIRAMDVKKDRLFDECQAQPL